MLVLYVFCFKQKTAYELRISDWSSDVCSSDLVIIWLGWRQRSARPGGPRSVLPVPAQDDPVDVACQAQLFFWILTVSLAIPVGVCFALWVIGDRKSVVWGKWV